ncbi:MAG: hypothetical protein ACYSWP_12890 [Planctomycetota bacterium]|jgi:hypothetical protein
MIIKTKVLYDYHAHIGGVGTEKDPLMEHGQDILVFSPKPRDELSLFLDQLMDECNHTAPEILAPTIARVVQNFRGQIADAIRNEEKP